MGKHVGETVVTCGLVVEQRTHHQITGEPMKFLTLADWTGMVETELFAQTYKISVWLPGNSGFFRRLSRWASGWATVFFARFRPGRAFISCAA